MDGPKLNSSIKLLFIMFYSRSIESNAFEKSINRKIPKSFLASVHSIRSFKSLMF